MPREKLLVRGTPFAWHERGDGERELVLHSQAARAVRFRIDDGRLTIGMLVAARRSAIDIRRQPSLLWSLVADAAVEHDCPPGQLRRRVSVELHELSRTHGGWVPADDQLDGSRLTLGLCYPMLGPVLDGGARALGEVPRWAAPVLAAPDLREAAAVGFGSKATRRVVRALASSVCSPSGAITSIRLVPLGFAMMGREILDADRLAAVLERPATGDVEQRWPDVDLVELGREQLPRLGAPRVARLLRDAADMELGVSLLRATLTLLQKVGPQLPARLPNALQQLYDLSRSAAPIDPAPRLAPRDGYAWDDAMRCTDARRASDLPPAPPNRPEPAAAIGRTAAPTSTIESAEHRVREIFGPGTTGVNPSRPVPSHALAAPTARRSASGGTIRHSQRVRAIDHLDLGGDLQLVLARTKPELAEWGRQLHNCIASFGPAVASGVSTILGVRLAGRLAYCLELTDQGEIRQFLGDRNHAVPVQDTRIVLRALLEHQLLDPERPANEPWLTIAAP